METYINNDTLIENETTKMLKSLLICPICNNIFINPVMCLKCQKNFCEKCFNDPNNKEKKCSCENATFQKSIAKNELLSQLKFTCVGCNGEIEYNKAQMHHDSCCPDKTSEDMNSNETPKQAKIKKIKPEEISLYKKDGEKIPRITSKIII
jgi:hypothetical protein